MRAVRLSGSPPLPALAKGINRWGLSLLVLACCEYPIVRKLAESIGSIRQPFPRVLTEGESLSGGSVVDVAVMLSGAIFALIASAVIPAIGSIALRSLTDRIWLEAWLLTLLVQMHVLTFYLLPWSSLLLPDGLRMWSLSGFRIPGPRMLEVPVAVVAVWCIARARTHSR